MKIKILVMDVDGTLTDGKIYIGSNGEIMKAFNVKDGMGITKLHKRGIMPAIITARQSDIVLNRARELNITEIYQGIDDKVKKMKELASKYDCSLSEIAYIGDDENDIECMKLCGISACPSDAVEQVLNVTDFISESQGGQGAVREFAEYILRTIE